MALIDTPARIHPTADVESDVEIGGGSAVWNRAQIRTGARIGAECVVGRDAFIDTNVVIGDRVKIQNAALLYEGVTVASGVFIGPGAIITNDRYPRAITPTGELARAGDWELTSTMLGTGCSIGAGAVVVAGCHIGDFATVGAGAVVTRPVLGHALVAGSPARIIGWVCGCGARLMTADGEPAPAEHERYASHPGLHCLRCDRWYDIEGDAVVPRG